MCLHYGVIPCCRPIPDDIRQFTFLVDKLIIENNWAQPGDRIILVAGQPLGAPGTTNSINVHNINA
jgi:pyruvate kinase